FGDEQWKVGVLVTGLFETRVQMFLDVLPQRKTVRPQDDATTHRRIGNQFRLQTDGGIPRGKVGRLRRNFLDDGFVRCLGHDRPRFERFTVAAFPPVGLRSPYGEAFAGMVKRTRVYTRTGDDGTTGLVGGARIAKHALRIACYGTVDELSSSIGAARAVLPRGDARANRLSAWLVWSQHVLFNLGSALATPE